MQLIKTTLRFFTIFVCVIVATFQATISANSSQPSTVHIKGIVRDSISTEGIPFASVMVEDSQIATVTDSRGLFEISVPTTAKFLTATCTGYKKKSVKLGSNSFNLYDINLATQKTELKEVVVKKAKYSKKNNPAVDFARRLRSTSNLNDPRQNDYYSYDKYEATSLGFNDFDTSIISNKLVKQMPFLVEHIDTSEVSGKNVLNLSFKEKSSSVFYRKSPKTEKEYIKGLRQEGIDEIISQDNIQTILDDILREVDLYQNDIDILRNRFVSPLSNIAPDFYRFYLVDTIEIDNDRCIALAFYPKNKASFGFKGHIYVLEGDSTMFIKRVDMSTPKGHNLNFIDNLYITQSFNKAPNGSRLKDYDNLIIEMSLIPGTQQAYVSRKISYQNHSFDKPLDTSIYDYTGTVKTDDNATNRDEAFWSDARRTKLQQGEANIDKLVAKLRTVPFYYWSEKIVKILALGYVGTRPNGKESKFDIGPVSTFASYNSMEGLRLRFGGTTTAALSPRWFGRGYVAYGFRDKKWKYNAELEYSFLDKKLHSREFPVHSLRLSHGYDIDQLGQHYLFTNADNFVLSLKRKSDDSDIYRRHTDLLYTLELRNNFSIEAKIENVRRSATKYVQFITPTGQSFNHYDETFFNVKLRYAPGEKFYQSRSKRININADAPIFVLSHTFAPKGFLNSKFCINKTEINIEKRFWLSAFGYINTMIGAGHIWNKAPYPDLFIPNANLSYTIQPQSFNLMNPMEFINSSYISWDFSYNMNGLIFNQIPYIKRLKLREVFGFKGLYGTLSKQNTPSRYNQDLFLFPVNAHTRPMDHGPYMECSVGLDNIFSILRIDYVWRLNYLDTPYAIDKHGVRVALHFTF